MNSEQRKVTYSMIHQVGYSPDKIEQEKLNELARKKEGLLLKLAEVDVDGSRQCVAVIEDFETRKIIQLEDLSLLTFID